MKYFHHIVVLLFIYSCSSVEIADQSVPIKTPIDENSKFIKFLDSEWEKSLNENPLFASYVGDKRLNSKINSNSIEQFNIEKQSNIESLNDLKNINVSNLSDDNILNLSLIHI